MFTRVIQGDFIFELPCSSAFAGRRRCLLRRLLDAEGLPCCAKCRAFRISLWLKCKLVLCPQDEKGPASENGTSRKAITPRKAAPECLRITPHRSPHLQISKLKMSMFGSPAGRKNDLHPLGHHGCLRGLRLLPGRHGPALGLWPHVVPKASEAWSWFDESVEAWVNPHRGGGPVRAVDRALRCPAVTHQMASDRSSSPMFTMVFWASHCQSWCH